MKKIFQIIIEDEDAAAVARAASKLTDKKADWHDDVSKEHIDIFELDQKVSYSEKDDFLILLSLDVRISKDSSPEFIAGFSTMIVFWDKLKDAGYCYEWHYPSRALKVTLGKLREINCFLSRMAGLKYEGHLEVKLDVHPWTLYKNTLGVWSEERCKSELLDRHATLLEWTTMNQFTPV